MRVANTYFPAEDLNAMWYYRKAGTEEDPALAALSGQAKQFAKQALDQIEKVEEPAQLEAMLAQMQGALTQAPEELKPAVELIIASAEARLVELNAAGEEE